MHVMGRSVTCPAIGRAAAEKSENAFVCYIAFAECTAGSRQIAGQATLLQFSGGSVFVLDQSMGQRMSSKADQHQNERW
jgi:hypothetical protein